MPALDLEILKNLMNSTTPEEFLRNKLLWEGTLAVCILATQTSLTSSSTILQKETSAREVELWKLWKQFTFGNFFERSRTGWMYKPRLYAFINQNPSKGPQSDQKYWESRVVGTCSVWVSRFSMLIPWEKRYSVTLYTRAAPPHMLQINNKHLSRRWILMPSSSPVLLKGLHKERIEQQNEIGVNTPSSLKQNQEVQ